MSLWMKGIGPHSSSFCSTSLPTPRGQRLNHKPLWAAEKASGQWGISSCGVGVFSKGAQGSRCPPAMPLRSGEGERSRQRE